MYFCESKCNFWNTLLTFRTEKIRYLGCDVRLLGLGFMYSFLIIAEQSRKGSLFTLFLFSPLVAFCYVCSIADLRSDLWDSCQRQVRRIMNDSLRVLYDWSRSVGKFSRHVAVKRFRERRGWVGSERFSRQLRRSWIANQRVIFLPLDLVFFQLVDDEFLRLMILRFIFCFYTMHLHRAFKVSSH